MPAEPLSKEERATLNTLIGNSKRIHRLLLATDDDSATSLTDPRVDFYQPEDRTFHLGLPDGSFRDVPLGQIVEIHLK